MARHFHGPLRPSTLFDQLVQQIRVRIIGRHLRPGDKLPNEILLAEEFGVSRSVVREAIRTLAQEGLVEVRRGLGTFVIDGTTTALKQSLTLVMTLGDQSGPLEIVEIRDILEPEIAAIAAIRATDADLEAMRRAVTLMDDSLDDPIAFVSADLDFHLALAQATQNSLIPKLLDPIVDLLTEMRRKTYEVDRSAQRGQRYHKDILDAILRRDAITARHCMRQHLLQVRSDYEKLAPPQQADGDTTAISSMLAP